MARSFEGLSSCLCGPQSGAQSVLHLLHAQLLPVAGAEPSVRSNVDRQRCQSHKIWQVCVLHPLQYQPCMRVISSTVSACCR